MSKHNAAFINALADEGSKLETLEFLQQTWDDLQNLRIALIKLGWTSKEIQIMMDTGSHRGERLRTN